MTENSNITTSHDVNYFSVEIESDIDETLFVLDCAVSFVSIQVVLLANAKLDNLSDINRIIDLPILLCNSFLVFDKLNTFMFSIYSYLI